MTPQPGRRDDGLSMAAATRPRRRRQLLTRLLWREQWPYTLASTVVVVIMGAAAPLSAWVLKLLLDRLTQPGATAQEVVRLVVALALISVAIAVVPVIASYIDRELERRVDYRIQELVTDKLNRFEGLAVFEDPDFHDRILLAQQGAQGGPPAMLAALSNIIRQSISALGFIVAVATVSPVVAVLLLVAAVPALVAELRFSRHRVQLSHRLSTAQRRAVFFNFLQSSVPAAKELRLNNARQFVRDRLLGEHATMQAQNRTLDVRLAKGRSTLAVLGALVAGAALAVVALRAIAGTISVGDVTVTVAAVSGIQAGTSSLVSGVANLREATMRFDYFVDLMAADEPLTLSVNPPPVPSPFERIEFVGVGFRYPADDRWVLRGLDLTIRAGRSIAVIGPNGAGKSTVVKLLARFYDPQEGVILWNGIDIRSLDVRELRQRVRIVFQDYVEYDLTVAENIALQDTSDPSVGRRVVKAAHRAGADDMVARLPRGYATMLSRSFGDVRSEDPGVELSGGQWQLIAIARMYMHRDADVQVLDEPTAALDAAAERHLITQLRDRPPSQAVVLITHRVASTAGVDEVAVLDNGRVIERGSPEGLLSTGGMYARYHRYQHQGYEPASPKHVI